MKKILNTLYITSEDAYLSLDGENVKIQFEDGSSQAFPLHNLACIISFSFKGASPALMGKCASYGIQLSFFSPFGRYLATSFGETNGNVLLRREQYRWADNTEQSLNVAKCFIVGKLYNAKYVLLRCARDHAMQTDVEKLKAATKLINEYLQDTKNARSKDELRGIEGNAAAEYFVVFNELILQNKDEFIFKGRNRRPPTDNINALLSFAYSLLANDCACALKGVGLDPYVGFMHTDRPGRASLALDLMEELRSVYADRFVITLINTRILTGDDFKKQESGAVILTDNGRKTFLSEWQKKKKEVITHPFLKEKISWGLVPHVQAMLLSRFIRGDLDAYPPFFWK